MALKNRIKVGTAIDKDLHEKLKLLSKKSRIPMSKLLDEALNDLIKKHANLTKK